MRLLKSLSVLFFLLVVFSCGDDERDDTILRMSDLTGKFWYNNRWLGDKYNFVKEDVLEVLKFEKNGKLSVMDFGGRVEKIVGDWSAVDNEITLVYDNGDREIWDVLHSGGDYITVVVNQGERKYVTKPEYLQELTADAFLVNEYTTGNSYQTYMGVNVRGNINIREAALIRSADVVIPLHNKGYYWSEREPERNDYIDFEGREQLVRFYFKIGKDQHLKLTDRIYGENLEKRTLADVELNATNLHGVTTLTVTWNPYASSSVFYRVEVFDERMDLLKPYFVGKVQFPGTSKLEIKSSTAGEVNRISEMKPGQKYIVRLSSLLYEPEIDVNNDQYGYANVQAVTYVMKRGLWE